MFFFRKLFQKSLNQFCLYNTAVGTLDGCCGLEKVGMTSLSKITATSWSAPVSSANTPREIDAVRKSKLIGRHVKPVIGGKVLLTQKVIICAPPENISFM